MRFPAVLRMRTAVKSRIIGAALAVPFSVNASASVFTVDTLGDDRPAGAPCIQANCATLRDAILAATAAGRSNSIVFSPKLSGTITLQSALPILNLNEPSANLAISGTGATVIISGNNQYRVFFADQGSAAISNLTIANGRGQGGAGGQTGGGGGLGAGGGLFVNNAEGCSSITEPR